MATWNDIIRSRDTWADLCVNRRKNADMLLASESGFFPVSVSFVLWSRSAIKLFWRLWFSRDSIIICRTGNKTKYRTMAEVAPPLLETSPGSEFTVSATTRSIKPNQSPTLCSAKCEQLREQRVCVNKLQVLRNKPRRNQITWVGLTPR